MDRNIVVGIGSVPADDRAIVPWAPATTPPPASSSWVTKYGDRHRMRRVAAWPTGIDPPRKVRIYVRGGAFLLQWWEPGQRKNVAERVEGDLVAAIPRAREIDRQLLDLRSS